ncbi:aldo/keto reductase [Aliifodinibius sp. S!AR15-10]|uniref:aldo/keto reductase n=1 Tax=Aliifodinibius sp. S!AR15-10 TaxID=2950437 RepID=UPI00286373F1|nr:aldo/keto reductase [Aliifodinibius sp. S!AR15-10]MDR8394130.1 aldo/keto reductase [Aliifodinibius sp. S!AR15-10]
MEYRSFKEASVAEVGLGTWQLGSSEWGEVDEEEAFSILQAYLDNGGNFIDTADIYGMGISERKIGKFLKQAETDRDIYVATKLGRREDDGYGWPQNFTYKAMREHVVSSLENLGVDQLFLDQFHCIPKEQLEKGDVFDHFRKIQDEGLIKHWGVSVETAEEAKICLQQEGLGSLQIIFNLFRQHMANEFFEVAAEKDVALIVRVPLASGLLTGKFDENTTFPEDDHRNFNADGEAFNVGETFSGIEFSKGIELTRKIQDIMPKGSMPQLALRWILDHPQVTTVIPGATKKAHVESNTGASDLQPLGKEAHKKLRELYEAEIRPNIRGRY